MLALGLLSASSLQFEVLLTKFFANKLEHHFTFAIISMALLGFGAAGVAVQLRGEAVRLDEAPVLVRLWRYALGFAVAMPLSVAIFLALPLGPSASGLSGAVALPVYFALFAGVFFLSGVCVCMLLVARGTRPSVVYFWDLLGAGLGAAAAPFLLGPLGGYGSLLVASVLALAGAVLLRGHLAIGRAGAWARGVAAVSFSALVLVAMPRWLQAAVGFDMVSFKHTPLRQEFLSFGPVAQTYWNPIARVDVSPTGSSSIGGFRYGLSRHLWQAPLLGRMVLVDGSANTRQFYFEDQPDRSSVLAGALWAAPYALHPGPKRTLVIGPGGGIDILVGKIYGVGHIDALELNPDVYRLLIGRPEDPEAALYTRWLKSDDTTRVAVHNVEARHYVHAHSSAQPYDVVLASGVDTLTAIQSAGNALTENFLYTRDAVGDYLRVLAPGGLLALTHWHLEPPTLALRMFVTYLEALEQAGVTEPGKRVCVMSEGFWESTILKKGSDFTPDEIGRFRALAAVSGFQVVYDPLMEPHAPVMREGDRLFRQLAGATARERNQMLEALRYDVRPATDDRPYFYWVRDRQASGWAANAGGWIFPQPSLRWMLALALVAALGLALGPALAMRRQGQRLGAGLWSVPFFALSGLAFIVAENALFLLLTLYVGGPLYSLSIVLPCVLIGYSLGSLGSRKVAGAGKWAPGRLAAVYVMAFGALAAAARWLLPSLMALGTAGRVMVAIALVLPFGAALGLAVPWYMDRLKAPDGPGTVAWMWGVSGAANVTGSLLYVPICQQLGVRQTFLLAAAAYVAALAWGAVV